MRSGNLTKTKYGDSAVKRVRSKEHHQAKKQEGLSPAERASKMRTEAMKEAANQRNLAERVKAATEKKKKRQADSNRLSLDSMPKSSLNE